MLKEINLRTILVVDDDQVARTVYSYYLKKLGYAPDMVATGDEAINCTKNKDYSAVILDLGLPGCNGEQVLSEIRKREKETGRHLPVIIVTAHGDSNILTRLKTQQKADDGFIKPVRFLDFKQALQKLYYKEVWEAR